MSVVTNAKQQKITRIISGEILPLVRCRTTDRCLARADNYWIQKSPAKPGFSWGF
ncbi:DUF4087 domain-containing protein [Mesorhizobium sp. M0136]|uniref:hypothetical protein n=1 Tax=Mesorhizobium sp. M0136 TaxID=2956890 RepID=UPI00333B61A6